jgi:hypothetical protein
MVDARVQTGCCHTRLDAHPLVRAVLAVVVPRHLPWLSRLPSSKIIWRGCPVAMQALLLLLLRLRLRLRLLLPPVLAVLAVLVMLLMQAVQMVLLLAVLQYSQLS